MITNHAIQCHAIQLSDDDVLVVPKLLVLKSLREDMKQEQGAASTALDQDGEQTDKESTSTILTTPQTLNSTERETVNQLAIKARDSLEKKKKGSKASSKKNKKSSGSSPGGTSR